MAVYQRGGSYFHHRLSQLYSDTKQSYESVTVTSRTEDDPEVRSLRTEYRTQKDRLLAWGLDWSDSNAAQFPEVEIDKSIDQAGFGDVVAHIMSTIQDILVQTEALQNDLDDTSTKGYSPGSYPDDGDMNKTAVSWTGEQMSKARALLAELTACIDYLFKLSEARRTSRQDLKPAVSKEEFMKDLKQTQSRSSFESERTLVNPGLGRTVTRKPMQRDPPPLPPRVSPSHGNSKTKQSQKLARLKSIICERALGISIQCISLHDDGLSTQVSVPEQSLPDEVGPPAYDEVISPGVTRILGSIDGRCLSAAERDSFHCESATAISILVEITPVQSWNKTILRNHDQAHIIIAGRDKRVLDGATGLPALLGYFADRENDQHIAVYRIPDSHTLSLSAMEDSDTISQRVQALSTLYSSGSESSDRSMPSLEDRFRLAFNLVVSVLQFHGSGLMHGNINSTNVLIAVTPSSRSVDYRDPLLVSQLNFLSQRFADLEDEPLTTRIYRHPRERASNSHIRLSAFDIYSLGMVLLEIGLWTPIGRLWKPKYNSEAFRSRIKGVYINKLAPRCGSAYMEAVRTCFNAPEAGISTATYTEGPITCLTMVLEILSRCCALDLQGPPTEPIVIRFKSLAQQEQDSLRSQVAMDDVIDSDLRRVPSISQDSLEQAADSSPSNDIASPTEKHEKVLLKKWDTIDIPQADLDQWHSFLMPRLSKLLQKILDNSSESCSASLTMVGKTADTAKTTICVQCSNVELVRMALKQNFRGKKGWGLVVLKGDVQRSKHPKKSKRKGPRPPASVEDTNEADTFYQQRPKGGASIGAYRDFEHLPPVSFGGAVKVGGELYGMTVHHMLAAPDEDEPQQAVRRSAALTQAALDDLSHMGAGIDDTTFEIEEDEWLELEDVAEGDAPSEFWFSDMADLTDDDGESEDDDDDDLSSVGDVEGVDPAEGDQDLIVTQPAIDDVEDDFFPTLEDKDDDHLSSHSLGYVHASSGIRRVTRGGVKHEVDWALIKINNERLPTSNGCLSSDMHNTAAVVHVAPITSLPNTHVLCHGRTSGLQSGRISPALALIKMHGRQSFSSSWCVDGNFGVPGDSGAWVFDPIEKRLCGHVLAWGNRSKVAFIAPMEVLFEDIEKRMGGKVHLPDAVDIAQTIMAEKSRSQLLADDSGVSFGLVSGSVSPSESGSGQDSLSDKLSIDLDLSSFRHLSVGSPKQSSRQISIPSHAFRKDVPDLLYQGVRRSRGVGHALERACV